MVTVVISGKPGCGSSTTAKLLAKRLGLAFFSAGEYYKKIASKHQKGTTTERSIKFLESKKGAGASLNRHVENKQVTIVKKGNVVIESKIGISFVGKYSDFKVWLEASKKIRAERYIKREGFTRAQAVKYINQKDSLERTNFKKLYGTDSFSQKKMADIVVDTGNKTPEKIVDLIISKLNAKACEKIWNMALPYQDKRDDKGHAETVTFFAKKLLETEPGNSRVVIPAAILHDIGWSKVSRKESMGAVSGRLSDEQDKIIRLKHEKLGAELARYLLRKANYDSKLTQEICKIIDGHDTRRRYDNSKKFLSKNDGLVQDADKLWRVSRKGMIVDMKRKNLTALQYHNLARKIDRPGYFYSKTALKLAKEELAKRKKEFKI